MSRLVPLVSAVALLAAACGGDDPERLAVTTDDIVGTWDLESADREYTTSGEFGGEAFAYTTTGVTATAEATATFSPDGTYVLTGDYELAETVTFEGETSPATSNFVFLEGARGEWSLEGEVVVFRNSTASTALGPQFAMPVPDTRNRVVEFVPGARLEFVIASDTVVDGRTGPERILGEQRYVYTR